MKLRTGTYKLKENHPVLAGFTAEQALNWIKENCIEEDYKKAVICTINIKS